MTWRACVRASRKFTFKCPTCDRVSVQNNTVVDEDTRMACHNVNQHQGGGVRIMKLVKEGITGG